MDALSHKGGSAGRLLEALNGATHPQASLVYLASQILWGVCQYLAFRSGANAIGLVFALVGLFVSWVGLSAAGIMLMDDSRGQAPRSVADAVLAAVFVSGRFIAVAVIAGLAFVGYLLVLATIYLVCKIPGIGPILYAIAFPVTTVTTGIVLFGLLFVVVALVFPALWAGETITEALAHLWELLRHRLLFVIVNVLLLTLLVALATLVVLLLLGLGATTSGAISLAVLGQSTSVESLLGVFESPNPWNWSGRGGGTGAYAAAALFGAFLLMLLAIVPLTLILAKGLCLTYLSAIEGLDVGAAHAKITQGVAELKQRAEAASERARQAASRPSSITAPSSAMSPALRQPSTNNLSASERGASAAVTACPRCQATVTAADAFCGNCGARLK